MIKFVAALCLDGLLLAGCAVEYTVPMEGGGQTSGDSTPDETDAGECEALECDGACVDPESDQSHCGDCDMDCGPGGSCVDAECIDSCGNACDVITEVCVSGTCECRPGFDRCDGTCTDLDIDAANCGECGEICADDEDGAIELYMCEASNCVEPEDGGCSAGLAECGLSCVDLQTHPLHCNACNRSCNGDEVCIDGECLEA